jgi:hypothetical protein
VNRRIQVAEHRRPAHPGTRGIVEVIDTLPSTPSASRAALDRLHAIV